MLSNLMVFWWLPKAYQHTHTQCFSISTFYTLFGKGRSRERDNRTANRYCTRSLLRARRRRCLLFNRKRRFSMKKYRSSRHYRKVRLVLLALKIGWVSIRILHSSLHCTLFCPSSHHVHTLSLLTEVQKYANSKGQLEAQQLENQNVKDVSKPVKLCAGHYPLPDPVPLMHTFVNYSYTRMYSTHIPARV